MARNYTPLVQVGARVTPQIKEKLEQLSKSQNLTISEFISKLIEKSIDVDELNEHENRLHKEIIFSLKTELGVHDAFDICAKVAELKKRLKLQDILLENSIKQRLKK